VLKTLLVYLCVGALHVVFRRKFFTISRSAERARASGLNVHFWDLIFYMTFGLVVTSSVQMAGVLLVFSFLVVPAACAMMFFNSIASRLMAGWGIGLLASLIGLWASATWDLPTGASVVATFGALLIGCAVLYKLMACLHPSESSA